MPFVRSVVTTEPLDGFLVVAAERRVAPVGRDSVRAVASYEHDNAFDTTEDFIVSERFDEMNESGNQGRTLVYLRVAADGQVKRAVAYLRVSAHGFERVAALIKQQIGIQRVADDAGYEVVRWYEEGDGVELDRSALGQLLRDVFRDDREFNTVLVWNSSRLSRDAVRLAELQQTLCEHGVDLVEVSENPCPNISGGETGGVVLAVGYIRCSEDGVQAKAAVEAQKAQIQGFADAHGVKIVGWHVDVGHSGRDSHRPGLQALLAAAEAPDRGFNAVLVCAWNRLSRCPVDLVAIRSSLSESGIRLVSVTEPDQAVPMEKLPSGVLEAIGGFHRENLAHETRMGLRHAARQGYWVSARVPYGYRRVEVNDSGRRRSKLEIDPETAEVVRAMYDRAVQGTSPRMIATELNSNGVLSPSGGTWNAAQVRRILNNPVNAGVVVVGKNSDAPVEVLDAHPKIVCRAVLEKVRELLKRGASKLGAS